MGRSVTTLSDCVKVLLFSGNFNIRRSMKTLSLQISNQSLRNLLNLLKHWKIKSKFSENLPYAVLNGLVETLWAARIFCGFTENILYYALV